MSDLEKFIEQNLPPHLKAKSFDEGLKTARKVESDRLTAYWHAQLALGWRPAELLGQTGSMVLEQHADGTPVRTIDPLPRGLRRDVRDVLAGLSQRGISLDTLSQGVLEAVHHGHSPSRSQVQAIVEQGQKLIAGHDYAAKAEVKVEEHLAELTVHIPIRVVGGRKYAPGTYRVTPEEEAMLLKWLSDMEAQLATGRTPDSLGFSRWPPFTLEGMPMPTEEVTATPAQTLWGSK